MGRDASASSSPFKIELKPEQRQELESRARPCTAPYWQVVPAKVVLLTADGVANNEIARRLGTSPQVVCRWRERFCEPGLAALKDRARSGRPRVFGAQVATEVKTSPASCRPRQGCPCHGGAAPSWPRNLY